jgi:3-oxoacyl-[acyl-carrier protein] reductase
VVIADIDAAAADQTAATIEGAFGIGVDVTASASVRAAVDTVLARTGRIDILVNNAGIAGKAAPIGEQDEDGWGRIISVNMTGPFLCIRAVLPAMRQRSYGRIVNIASIAGKEGNPNMVPYSATKAGLIGLTKAVAKEVATEGICINAVAPAVVHTKILDQLTPAQVSYMTEKIPMRRTGKPEEIAAVVHFLASPDASFITGQCYDASGGRATY